MDLKTGAILVSQAKLKSFWSQVPAVQTMLGSWVDWREPVDPYQTLTNESRAPSWAYIPYFHVNNVPFIKSIYRC